MELVVVSHDKVPEQSKLAQGYKTASYQDCFSKDLVFKKNRNPADLFQDMFSSMPAWISGLMAARNWIVKFFGLKTSVSLSKTLRQKSEDLVVGGHIGFFEIISLDDREVVVTANDRHLDSSFSLYMEGEGDQKKLFLTSVVNTKEWFGDAYMFVIAPFHRLIVRHLLKRLV